MRSFIQNQMIDVPVTEHRSDFIDLHSQGILHELLGNRCDSRNEAKEKPMNTTLVRTNLKPELKRNVWETIENRFDQFVLDMVNMIRILIVPDNRLYAYC